jgi:hypothetical protein
LKIRIDQNLSFRVARAIVAALPNRDGYEVSYVGDEHPPRTQDPDWLRKFADEGGTAIISGDFNILRNWPDLVAYTETGLISFFTPSAFEKLNRFGKVAFIIRWWPAIIEQIKLSKPGDRWRLPMRWENPSHTLFELLEDPRVKGRVVERAKSVDDANVVNLPRKGS